MKTEHIEINGKVFKRTYDDTFKIQKIGTEEIYDEAIDLQDSDYQYIVTDIPKESEVKEGESGK